jgi:hypothetical protein
MLVLFLTFTFNAFVPQVLAVSISPQFTIASGVAPADSNITMPGRSAVGFDGTNHLLVSCRNIGSPTGVFGVLVSGSGEILGTFPIFQQTCPASPAVGFDGTNYLVVLVRGGQIFGTRVSPDGTVLDGPNGFAISSGPSNSSPAIAFDGVHYLVVWNKFIDGSQDIFGALVSSSGEVSSEIGIFRAPGEPVFPSAAFDGFNYFVVWRDNQNGPSIIGTRVTPDGVVIDPEAIAVSTAPGVKDSPVILFDGVNYFAVWVDGRLGSGGDGRLDIFGSRISPDGSLLDGPPDTGGITINTGQVASFSKGQPTVGFDGINYFVVWAVVAFPNFPPAGVFGSRVSTDGVVIDGPPEGTGISISSPPCSACRLVYPSLVFNGGTYLLAWVNNTELSGATKDIVGVLIDVAN